jgi:putative aldouronate transport system substrate-binding protein
MRNSIEFIRALYKEGLMDPVMPIQSYADWLAKITGDRLGHFLHFPANLTRFSDFMLNNPGQKGWSYLPLVKVPDVPRQKIMFMRMGVPGLMITKAAKHPEKIIQWFNWGRTEEASLYKQLGIPGLDWKREDGKITILRTEQKPRYWSYIHVGVKYVPEATKLTEHGDMMVRATEQVKNDVYYGPDNLYMPLSVYEGYEDYDPTVTKLYREMCSKMITGELDMSAWDEYVNTWYRNGGEVVTARANEWYKQTRR